MQTSIAPRVTLMQTPRESRRITTGYVSTTGAPPESAWPEWVRQMKREYERQIADERLKFINLQKEHNNMANAVNQTETARTASDRALELYGESEGVKALTDRLTYMLPNAQEIGKPAVALVAQIAVAHGLDPMPGSDHIYAYKQGSRLVVMIGYKGLLHLGRRQSPFTYQSRPMTDAERQEHGVQQGEIGYITELHEIAKAAQCKAVGVPYFPVVGSAVWKPGMQVPQARTAAWVAKKNSLKDALRQITTTGQRIQEALDAAFSRYGMQFEQDGDQWSAPLPGDDDAPLTIESAVASGLVPPDSDVEDLDAPLCLSCGNRPATDNPIDANLCDVCAAQIADADAVR